MKLLHEGSAKNKVRTDAGEFCFDFQDTFSVFDRGKSPQVIPGKAKAVCAMAVQSAKIAKLVGVPTCFVKQLGPTLIEVVEAEPITDRPLTAEDTNCVVPKEFIDRIYVAGSVHLAFTQGKKKPTAFGFPDNSVPRIGTPFPFPINHSTTKWGATDEDLTHEESLALCGMTLTEEERCWAMTHRWNAAIDLVLRIAGYGRLDGKREFLFIGKPRTIIAGDVGCTQDEDRPVPLADLEAGRIEHYSKEFIRQHYKETGYYDELQAARAVDTPVDDQPPYPPFPASFVKEVSRRYTVVAEAYANIDVESIFSPRTQ